MGNQNKLDFVMTPDGDLVPAEEVQSSVAPPPVTPRKVAPPPMPQRTRSGDLPPFPPLEAKAKPPALPPPDRVEGWGADRTDPVAELHRPPALADDLDVPPPAARPRAVSDESLTSEADVDAAIRDEKYRDVVERVSNIDEDEPYELSEVVDEPRIIKGAAVSPPPSTKLSVTGSGPNAPSPPESRKVVPRVLTRPIKEKNRS
jgi:hypothetical protein